MKGARCAIGIVLFMGILISCHKPGTPSVPTPTQNDSNQNIPVSGLTYRGLDLSYDYKIEDERGIRFYDSSGNASPLFQICAAQGVNIIRLRLWVNPSDSDQECSLPAVKKQALKISGAGMKLWLDLHYSDTWADPGHQTLPAAWTGISYLALLDSVYDYTYNVINQLQQQGTPPEIVQVGNEINAGMLWPFGNVSAYADSNWTQLAAIIDTAESAIKKVNSGIKVMIHFAGINGADQFYSQCDKFGIPYDLIGISFYPWWHGKDLSVLQSGLNTLTSNHANKGILIAETAYPFTLSGVDQASNIVGDPSQLISTYPASSTGQLDFLVALMKTVKNVTGGGGLGVCYWEPDWVAYNGPAATDWQNGSDWENLALFDFNFKALPGLQAFKSH
ncbi:MAG TPA: glycosyl hydrolase 53 family protein [Chitinophagaceae bacterium]|nr:glycosyl hydrolase 53 family protein [Chitinophagaceae bacterium]